MHNIKAGKCHEKTTRNVEITEPQLEYMLWDYRGNISALRDEVA